MIKPWLFEFLPELGGPSTEPNAQDVTLRLGVMGVVLPYYHPARVAEEIGMLDHLTGGRLEIGTAIGVPQELSRLNMTMAEARERNDEIVAFLDAALANRIVSHRGKYFSFSNLRLLPRP